MPDDDLRSIEPLIAIVLGCMCWKSTQAHEVRSEKKDDRRTAAIKPKRRLQCPTAPKVLDLAEPRDAQFVMAGLVSSGTTGGGTRFVPRSASTASGPAGKVTAIGWAGSRSPSTSCQRTVRGLCDGPDLKTRQGILRDSTDFAPRCPYHDRLSDCEP